MISAPRVQWSPLPRREDWSWPGGAKLAASFVFHLEFLPLTPPGDIGTLPASAVHRGPYPRYLDVHEVTPHEYGNRVGLFRLMDLFDGAGVTASAAIDTVVAQDYEPVVRAVSERGWSVLGHGRDASQAQGELMPEAEESAQISENLEALRSVFDRPVRGWAGVEYAESSRTLDLLATHGLSYVVGWPNDEQPYPLGESLVCLPVSIHLDDVFAGRMRKVTAADHADSVIRAADVLVEEPGDAPRMLVLGLHPWYSGQPFRSVQVRRILDRIAGDPRIWVTDTDSIVEHYSAVKGIAR